jgi:formate dehydrogenase maturation protein FdhE
MAQKRSIEYFRTGLDPYSPEGIEASLCADEEERKERDKRPARYCPVCGRIPEDGFDQGGRHIFIGYCNWCKSRFVVHVNG